MHVFCSFFLSRYMRVHQFKICKIVKAMLHTDTNMFHVMQSYWLPCQCFHLGGISIVPWWKVVMRHCLPIFLPLYFCSTMKERKKT
jgi:hypothetical protein